MEVCAECNTQIEDQYVLRVGESSLHQECLKCAACRAPLQESCFSKVSATHWIVSHTATHLRNHN